MLIYLQNTSPRSEYIVSFLSSFFNCELNYTTELNNFQNFKGVKINYSSQSISEDEVWIKPHGLLDEKTIHELKIICKNHKEGFLVLFPSNNDFGFDILSAIFYLISRYEEYLPHKKDMYGRYAHENSIAFKNNFLHLPLINTWLEYFKKAIQAKTGYQLNEQQFHFQSTYDIDIAWSFKNKGVLRNAGGIIKSLAGLKFKKVQDRIRVLSGNTSDPYDTYEWMEELHQQYNLNPIYFFHVGMKRTVYDKNITPYNQQLQQLIRSLSVKNIIGLHPSWASGDVEDELWKEKKILEQIVSKEITRSRQHYIRLTLPETYRKLISAGIKYDYSMGYGSINGFRASIASSFYWYDLDKEEQTKLIVHPFCFMDANSFFEQKQNAEQTLTELNHYLNEVKKVKGTLTTIWHNNFLGTDTFFKDWNNVYKTFLNRL